MCIRDRFEVALEPVDGDRPDPQGAERAEFLVSANVGQPPRPLRKVASGGELSRVSLAIEVAALGHDAVPVSYTHLDVYKRQVMAGVVRKRPVADLFSFVIPDLIRDPFTQRRNNGSRIKSGMTKV